MPRRSKNRPKNRQQSNKNSSRKKNGAGVFHKPPAGNLKMEVYYALNGLHNVRLDGSNGQFVNNTTEIQLEHERKLCKSYMKKALPVSFRINMDVDTNTRQYIEAEFDNFVGKEMEIEVEIEEEEEGAEQASTTKLIKVQPARKLSFIPHAYQLELDRRTIKRNDKLALFHDYLVQQTAAGLITRQETVSMVPVIILGVQSHHSILDMCAAPGSKTSQLLEIVGNNNQGYIIANDADPKRAGMLVFQLRRINSSNHLVTSCNAQFFPKKLQGGDTLSFDRILCDVPCSGDGTTRKNPGIWRHWGSISAFGLHALQLSIALNGARLCKVGGFICYSTCSLNPIENEAVVAELLRSSEGSLELVDKRDELPGLVARPGMTSWRVLCETKTPRQIKNEYKKNNKKMQQRRQEWAEKQGGGGTMKEEKGEEETGQENGGEAKEEKADGVTAAPAAAAADDESTKNNNEQDDTTPSTYNSDDLPFPWDEATLLRQAEKLGLVEYRTFEDVPEDMQRRIRKSCFPPTPEEAEKFGLHKCLRILPQDMDTGGFFVALLRKVAPMSAKAKEEAARLASELEAVGEQPDSKRAKVETEEADDVEEATSEKESSVVEADDEATTSAMESDAIEMVKDGEDDFAADDTSKPPAKITQPLASNKGRGNRNRRDVQTEHFSQIEDESLWEPLVEFYGLSPSFPKDQYMVRACGEAKILYYIGKPIKELFDRSIQDRVTIINTGLKGFERNTRDCDVSYRVNQEGIQFLVPYMTKRKVVVNRDDFLKCLGDGAIPLDSFSTEAGETMRAILPGSFVVILEEFEDDPLRKMILAMWRCRGDSINSLVAKVEREAMISKVKALMKKEREPAPGETL